MVEGTPRSDCCKASEVQQASKAPCRRGALQARGAGRQGERTHWRLVPAGLKNACWPKASAVQCRRCATLASARQRPPSPGKLPASHPHLLGAQVGEGGDGHKVHLAHVEQRGIKQDVVLFFLRQGEQVWANRRG